ncbi:glucosidase II [Pleurotus ostreatus]|nr:glucosidase II [Pleurotus ostreatus]
MIETTSIECCQTTHCILKFISIHCSERPVAWSGSMYSLKLLGALVLLISVPQTFAVKSHDFKTCSQAGFCRRGRALASRAKEASSWASPYSIDLSTIEIAHDSAKFTAQVKSSLYPDVKFGLDVRLHTDGVVRVRMDEINGLKKHYDEAASWALISEPEVSKSMKWSVGKTEFKAKFGEGQEFEIVVQFNPLKIVLLKESKEQIVLNGQGLLHMEHFRSKKVEAGGEQKPEGSEGVEDAQTVIKVQPNAWFEGEDEDAYWEETFGSWTDSKPKGPESLSIDISFPNHANIYGIPQHATRLSLPSTTGESPHFEDPYRLYNTDVFEYIASSPMSLYGSIPILHAHSADSTVGIFHAVGSETWIDVSHATDKSTETHWISESGILDIFLMPGPTPADVFAQYARLTGTPVLPAHWALGYHQCRWNYISSDDVRTVQKRFDEEGMPVDVFWLDIEYSQDHKYFMWEPKNFPDPVDMINDVAATGRHMVVIVDPHLKRVNEYPVYKEASERGVLVKPKSGEGEYEGWCWSGSSSWIDFFNPGAWDWWKSLFKPYQLASGGWSWTQSTEAVHIWNDMNEPSVFNGPEISMPRDNVHYNGWEHRDIHNINGMLFSNATYQALLERSDPPQRPFVLTRSFFAGSQRFGAMWTGDNLGTWEHMEVGVKMVLANGIAGMSFGGSDVGGFFGNPEPEMLVRWYQVGAMAPFFRAHAHIDTKRREPYLLDQPYKDIVRDILRLRYTMLPVWYTAFRETTVTGLPVLRPHYVMFPEDKNGFDLDGQYYIGSSGLLVKPVTEKGATEASVYLAEDQVYYDYFSHQVYRGSAKGKNITVPAALHQLPLFIRGGSIVSTRERPRRASTLMKRDPFTLRVALDKKGSARGELYIDDGETYSHRNGEFIWRQFFADKGKKELRISSKDLAALRPSDAVDGVALKTFNPANEFAKSVSGVRVERIVVLGLGSKPKSVKVEGGQILEWEYTPGAASNDKKDGAAGVLVIKDPATPIANNWEILVQF